MSLLLATLCLIATPPVFAASITDDEIDRFLVSIPVTSDLLDQVRAKLKQDNGLSKKLAVAQLDGKYMREIVSSIKSWPEYPQLEKQVKTSGFDSVDDWSLVVDRVFGVVSSAHWVTLVASMPIPNGPKPVLERDSNLFDYLGDEANDPKMREKYGRQLAEMCEKMCYDTADLPVVGARYNEIESVIKKK
ncbi:MAG: hypothetical protein P8178_14150 [Candidatus Thiodiazotropha sp.]